MLKSFWTSHLQMINWLESLFQNGTGRWKGTPKGVDETHPNPKFNLFAIDPRTNCSKKQITKSAQQFAYLIILTQKESKSLEPFEIAS